MVTAAAAELTPREQEDLAKLRAMDLFPTLEEEGSELHQAVATEMARLETAQPEFFKDPSWPIKIARKVAVRLHIQPRSLAAIYGDSTKSFRLDWKDDPSFHEVVIYEAQYLADGVAYDVTQKIVDSMVGNFLRLAVTEKLKPSILELDVRVREEKESDDYWKKQQKALAQASLARNHAPARLKVEYETHGKRESVTASLGEWIEISESGATVKKPEKAKP